MVITLRASCYYNSPLSVLNDIDDKAMLISGMNTAQIGI